MNKGNQTLGDMLEFIERILIPHVLMPRKTDLTDEQVLKLYSELAEVDETFRELEQIAILKRDIVERLVEKPNIISFG